MNTSIAQSRPARKALAPIILHPRAAFRLDAEIPGPTPESIERAKVARNQELRDTHERLHGYDALERLYNVHGVAELHRMLRVIANKNGADLPCDRSAS